MSSINKSDSESDCDTAGLSNILKKYASTKGKGAPVAPKVDKRTETSKKNMAKARAAKIAGLQQKKQDKQYVVSEDESSSEEDESSDDEELVITKKKPKKGGSAPPPSAVDDRMGRMEEILIALAKKKMKKKPAKRGKTIINVTNPAQVGVIVPNPQAQVLKHNILNF